MPKLRPSRSFRYKEILSRNLYCYWEAVQPLFETQKISKEEMTQLCCHAMHCIKPRSVKLKENDKLYEIFGEWARQPVSFMREWLKFFGLLHRKIFQSRAHSYLKSKGLSLDNWSKSITDGQKGDVLVLYCLNMLTKAHTVLHLKNRMIWSTLQRPPP